MHHKRCRSREGAWIEIALVTIIIAATIVAPARERGLKSARLGLSSRATSRSREGAWIEIVYQRHVPV